MNGAVAVDDGCWVQPHAGEDAAERIDAGTELIEGIAGQAADTDQAEIYQRLGLGRAAEGRREQGCGDDVAAFHRVQLVR